MCCMIAELGQSESPLSATMGQNKQQTKGCSSQSPLHIMEKLSGASRLSKEDNRTVRFPWTHRREPLDIHSINSMRLKNHVADSA